MQHIHTSVALLNCRSTGTSWSYFGCIRDLARAAQEHGPNIGRCLCICGYD